MARYQVKSLYEPIEIEKGGQVYGAGVITEAMLTLFTAAPARITEKPEAAFPVVKEIVEAFFPGYTETTEDVLEIMAVYKWLGEEVSAALTGRPGQSDRGKEQRPEEQ